MDQLGRKRKPEWEIVVEKMNANCRARCKARKRDADLFRIASGGDEIQPEMEPDADIDLAEMMGVSSSSSSSSGEQCGLDANEGCKNVGTVLTSLAGESDAARGGESDVEWDYGDLN